MQCGIESDLMEYDLKNELKQYISVFHYRFRS